MEVKKFYQNPRIVIGGLVATFVITILIIIASNNSDFPLGKVLLWVGLGIFLIILIYFGINFYDRNKKGRVTEKGELPEPITLEQARELIKKQLKSPEYADYTNGWTQHKIYNVGKTKKSRILLVQLEKTSYDSSPYQFFIMNMHYPTDLWAYLPQRSYNSREIISTVNSLATDPEDPVSVRTIERRNPLLGTEEKITETGKEDKKEDEKKEDLE